MATEPEDLSLGFWDEGSSTYLMGQFGDGHADQGMFIAVIEGVGVLWNDEPASVSVGMGGELILEYDGIGRRDGEAGADPRNQWRNRFNGSHRAYRQA